MSAIPVTISGDVAQVRFSTFDLAEYEHFLALKRTLPAPEMDLSYDWQGDIYTVQFPARYAAQLGVAVKQPFTLLPMAPDIWDYQRHFVTWALKRKRAAFFWDCGLGKTRAFLEFARQAMAATGRKALIVSIAGSLISQTIRQAKQFYGDSLPMLRIETREQLIEWLNGGGSNGHSHSGLADIDAEGNRRHIALTAGGIGSGVHSLPERFQANGLAIVNYEKFIPGQIPELRNLGALILDESSILKTGGGKIKWNIIHSAKGIEYKLSNTATPAPNEAMEYASQAAFLETIRNEGDVIWTYFKKNDDGSWRLIKHAEKAFYTFLASWSVFMRSPASYGFKDNIQPVPKPEYIIHNIPATPQQLEEAQMYRFQIGAGLLGNERMGVKERLKLSQIAKGFIYGNEKAARGNSTATKRGNLKSGVHVQDVPLLPVEGDVHSGVNTQNGSCRPHQGCSIALDRDSARKRINRTVRTSRRIASAKPEFIASLAWLEFKAGRQAVTWTVFDEEGEIIAEQFDRIGVPYRLLTGKTPTKLREQYIQEYSDGFPHIISKAELLGYGMNLECGSAMIFSGWNDSFEQWYQAIRRMVRYGQTERVRVHVPMIDGLEDAQLENVQAKAQAYEEQAMLQEQAYREALMEMNIGTN